MREHERDSASARISDRVIHSAWFQRAELVGCYLSIGDEVNTWDIVSRAWRMKKRVFAPVVKKNRPLRFREIQRETILRPNRMGLLQPVAGEIVAASLLDIVVTPVVAFDGDNNRVGMGGGYFDRTFAFLRHRTAWHHPKLIGVAFACQQVEKICPNPWDIRVFGIITENDARSA